MNPYLRAWTRGLRNRRRHLGWPGVLAGPLVVLVAVALLVPLVRSVFLGFLDLPSDLWRAGMVGVLVRAGVIVVGWLAIEVYTALIRGPDRAVLASLPVDEPQVVRYELARVAAERWWLLPAAAVLLSPVALAGAPDLWALGLLVLLGAWAMGLVVSAATHLLAVEVAESPRWEGVLDLVRGTNPRAQAAFIYAPGAVLLVCGLVVGQAAAGVADVSSGEALGWLRLAAPWPLVAIGWWGLDRLAHGSWFRASAVVAEIDARYAALTDREEALRVYLDWAVRWLPAGLRIWALRDLRHGWRARRAFVTGAWLIAVAAFVAGWTASPQGPVRAGVVGVAGVWLVSSLGLLLERDEPEFLRVWLPSGGAQAVLARAWALACWALPPVLGASAAVLFRRGWEPTGVVAGVGLVSLAMAVGTSLASAQSPRGMLWYVPAAVLLTAGAGAWLGGVL